MRAAAQRIHRATLDQRLQYAFVKQPQVDVLAEFINRLEASQFLPPGNNRLDRVAADILHSGQTEANSLAVRSKVRIRHVDIRRIHGDAHLAAFVDVLHHVVRTAGNRRKQRSHELHRIVRLEIGRVISQQRVSGGV